MLWTLPNLLRALPWLVAAAGLVYGVWERGSANSARADLLSFRAKAAQAVADQRLADAVESQRLLGEQERKLSGLNDQVSRILQDIHNAPSTNSCGPVVRDAARGVRRIIANPGRPNP